MSFVDKNIADAERRLIARDALAMILLTDRRVESQYEGWISTAGLDILSAKLKVAPAAKRDQVWANLLHTYSQSGASMISHALPSFVAKELRLQYPWLAPLLAAAFFLRFCAALGAVLELTIDLRVPRGQRRGRRAKGGGVSIRRNVEWYYRAHVQQPAESTRALARAYIKAGRLRVKSDARATVFDGIAAAKALLE